MAEKHDVHAGESMAGPHGTTDDHGADHGHDDHGHGAGEALGPFDLKTWGAAILGVALGLVVVVAFIQAAA